MPSRLKSAPKHAGLEQLASFAQNKLVKNLVFERNMNVVRIFGFAWCSAIRAPNAAKPRGAAPLREAMRMEKMLTTRQKRNRVILLPFLMANTTFIVPPSECLLNFW